MRVLKGVISLLLFGFCFLFLCEYFQGYTNSFTSNFNYFLIANVVDKEELVPLLEQLAEEQELGIFAVDREVTGQSQTVLTVMANKKAAEILGQEFNIQQREFQSIFSGSTEIFIKDFSEITEYPYLEQYYFIGDMESIRSVWREIAEIYGAGYIHKETDAKEQWVVYGIFIVSMFILLLINWFCLQLNKKEYFLKISMGQSMLRVILNAAMGDWIEYTLFFLLVNQVVMRNSGIYLFRSFYLGLFLLFLVIDTLGYFSMYFTSFKKIIYGGSLGNGILVNCYILKILTLILVIVSLSSNIALVIKNADYLSMYKTITALQKYDSWDLSTGDPNSTSVAEYDVFTNMTKEGKVAFSISVFEDYSNTYLMINKNASEMIQGIDIEKYCDCKNAFTVFIPEDKQEDSELYYYAISSTLNYYGIIEIDENFEKNNIGCVYYPEKVNVIYYDFGNCPLLEYGFDKANNPVFVFCTPTTDLLSLMEQRVQNGGNETFGMFEDLFFLEGALEENGLKREYQLISASKIGVLEYCNQYYYYFERMILLNMVVSILMCALELLLISMITKMEYMVNSKELALKKILGYSVLHKNKNILLQNGLAGGISLIILCIGTLMYWKNYIMYVIWVGIFCFLIENIMICFNIYHIEKTNVIRVLKGGCL